MAAHQVQIPQHRVDRVHRIARAPPGERIRLGGVLPDPEPGAEVLGVLADDGQGVVVGSGAHRVRLPPGAIPGSNTRQNTGVRCITRQRIAARRTQRGIEPHDVIEVLDMRVPQVSERIKEAPAQALRGVFAGIGQLLLITDKLRNKASHQDVPRARTPEASETVTDRAVTSPAGNGAGTAAEAASAPAAPAEAAPAEAAPAEAASAEAAPAPAGTVTDSETAAAAATPAEATAATAATAANPATTRRPAAQPLAATPVAPQPPAQPPPGH